MMTATFFVFLSPGGGICRKRMQSAFVVVVIQACYFALCARFLLIETPDENMSPSDGDGPLRLAVMSYFRLVNVTS